MCDSAAADAASSSSAPAGNNGGSSPPPPPPPLPPPSLAAIDAAAAAIDAAAAAIDAAAAAIAAAAAAIAAAAAAIAAAWRTLVACPILSAIVVYVVAGTVGFDLFPSPLGRGATTNSFVDALYFSVSTLFAMGYGDANPRTLLSRSFAILFNIIGYVVLNFFLQLTGVAARKFFL